MLALLVPGVGMGATPSDAPASAPNGGDLYAKLIAIGVGCLAGLLLLAGCA